MYFDVVCRNITAEVAQQVDNIITEQPELDFFEMWPSQRVPHKQWKYERSI